MYHVCCCYIGRSSVRRCNVTDSPKLPRQLAPARYCTGKQGMVVRIYKHTHRACRQCVVNRIVRSYEHTQTLAVYDEIHIECQCCLLGVRIGIGCLCVMSNTNEISMMCPTRAQVRPGKEEGSAVRSYEHTMIGSSPSVNGLVG